MTVHPGRHFPGDRRHSASPEQLAAELGADGRIRAVLLPDGHDL